MAIIPKPAFPNVPQLPGVPQLRRSPQFPAGPGPVISGALAGIRLFDAFFTQPSWGVYNSKGEIVIECDNISSFSYSNEANISDYPVQDGSFASYNKVQNPFESGVRMTKGGSQADRRLFIAQCEAVQQSLDLFFILTPERTYNDVNVTRFEMTRRGAKGAFFLEECDLFFRQIRSVTATYTQTATAVGADPKNPSASNVQNQGTVNGKRPDVYVSKIGNTVLVPD